MTSSKRGCKGEEGWNKLDVVKGRRGGWVVGGIQWLTRVKKGVAEGLAF
jgi:hypothetical protein